MSDGATPFSFSHLARAACRRSRWRPRQKSCTRATSTASAPSRTSIRLPRPPSRLARLARCPLRAGGGLSVGGGQTGTLLIIAQVRPVRRFGDGMRERRAKWLDWIKQKVRACNAHVQKAACATCQMQPATGSMPHHEMKRRALQCNIGASLQHSAPPRNIRPRGGTGCSATEGPRRAWLRMRRRRAPHRERRSRLPWSTATLPGV